MKYLIIAAALICAGIANADELAFSGNMQLQTGSSSMVLSNPTTKEMARISPNGEVQFDWPTVEECAKNEKLCSGTVSGYAKLILAAKNGTWKPLHAEKKPRCIEVDPLADDAGNPSKVVCK